MIRHIMAKNVYKFPNYFRYKYKINSSSVCDYDFNTVVFSNKNLKNMLRFLSESSTGWYRGIYYLACNADSVFIYYY